VIAVAKVDVVPETNPSPDPRRPRLPRGAPFFAVIAVAVLVLLVGGAGGAYQGKLSEVQKNDNSSYLRRLRSPPGRRTRPPRSTRRR